MDALLSGLQRPRAGTWITLGLVGAGAAGLFAWSVTESPAGCPSVDELQEEVWSSRRRAEVEASIRVAAPRRADEVWTMLAPMLDDYADTWARHHADACGVSADRTMTCLGRRRHAFTTLVEVLLEADASVVDRAPGATRRLPELQSCLDPQAAGGIPEPSDPAIRARVAELDARLTRVKTLEAAGRYRDAVHLAQATLADAEEVDHDPTTAFAAYRLGVVLVDAGRGDEAMPLLERAAFLALETGLDIVVAGAAIKLIARYAAHGDDEQVESWRRHAMAAIERGGLPQDVEARVHLELGAVAYAHTDFEAARTEAETAAKLYAASVGEEDPEYATAVNNMAGALFSLGEHDEALELMERSSAIRQRVLGPTHPMMQTSLSNLGSIAIQLDRLDEAERHLAQAREAYEADPTPHHMRHANLLLAEGALARRRGRFDDAVETILASLDASGRVGGPSSVVHDFRAHMQLVLVFTDARREADAVETADALVSSCEAIGACSDAHMLRAVTLAEFGRDDEARAARDRAQVLGPLDADLETSLAELLRQ